MNILKDLIVAGNVKYPFLLDLYYPPNGLPKPIVIFAHGFKGFKDWGHWDQIAQNFARAGFVFLKFNFSHNGTTLEQPFEFADLEAFGHNNYSKELADLDAVLDWLEQQSAISASELNLEQIHLIGHSRGGGIGLIKAIEEERIRSMIGWASVSRLDYAWLDPQKVSQWKADGVYYQLNGRTRQEMPLYYQFYEDYQAQIQRFDIPNRLPFLKKPLLLIHGTADPAVPHEAALQLQKWSPQAQVKLIDGANHVFGAQHPFLASALPLHSQLLVEYSLDFLTKT